MELEIQFFMGFGLVVGFGALNCKIDFANIK
jgi:hypothetical protein